MLDLFKETDGSRIKWGRTIEVKSKMTSLSTSYSDQDHLEDDLKFKQANPEATYEELLLHRYEVMYGQKWDTALPLKYLIQLYPELKRAVSPELELENFNTYLKELLAWSPASNMNRTNSHDIVTEFSLSFSNKSLMPQRLAMKDLSNFQMDKGKLLPKSSIKWVKETFDLDYAEDYALLGSFLHPWSYHGFLEACWQVYRTFEVLPFVEQKFTFGKRTIFLSKEDYSTLLKQWTNFMNEVSRMGFNPTVQPYFELWS